MAKGAPDGSRSVTRRRLAWTVTGRVLLMAMAMVAVVYVLLGKDNAVKRIIEIGAALTRAGFRWSHGVLFGTYILNSHSRFILTDNIV